MKYSAMAEITDNMNAKTSKNVRYGTYRAGPLFHSSSSLFFFCWVVLS